MGIQILLGAKKVNCIENSHINLKINLTSLFYKLSPKRDLQNQIKV